MKKCSALLAILPLSLTLALPVSANMAAPADPDLGSTVSFEKNDSLTVTDEVLDIVVTGSTAEITATYTMENLTQAPVSTPALFLAPNTGDGGVEVWADGVSLPFTTESYQLEFDGEATADTWRSSVLTVWSMSDRNKDRVEGISFQLAFQPGQTREVVVSYPYRLGGYPDYDFNVKRGEIEYYLAPCQLWGGFENLTINLYLDKDMPVLKDSGQLEFEKVAPRTYQYHTDQPTEGYLRLVVDESPIQEFFSTLRSPYLPMMLMFLSPVILIVLAVVILVVWSIRRRRRKNKLPPL